MSELPHASSFLRGANDTLRSCASNPRCAHLEGLCCPTSEGIRMLCCSDVAVSGVWTWTGFALTTTGLSVGLLCVAMVLPRSPSNFRREVSVALTSALVYTLMSVPVFVPGLLQSFDRPLQESYMLLPFWYAFVMTKTLGSFFELAVSSSKGTFVALLAMAFLNYLLPGGATLYSMTEVAQENSWTRWLGRGYHPSVAWIFTACFVYGASVARWNTCTKQYALGFFASVIVDFMNPKIPSERFSAVLWDYSFTWNVTGPMLSTVYILLAAIPLTALSLPIFPCNRRLRRFFSCRAMASKGLSKVAADTCGCLERLIAYFSEDHSHFDMESSFLYIADLGTRRTQIEVLLEQAHWECYNDRVKARLRCSKRVADLLRDLRQGLRVQLQQIKNNLAFRYTAEIGQHLNDFVQAMNDGMCHVATYSHLHRGFTKEELENMMACASHADAALADAMKTIPTAHRCERMFVDCLYNFPEALRCFAKAGITELEEAPKSRCRTFNLRDWSPHLGRFTRTQHIHAFWNTAAWLLALAWSRVVTRSTCVTTVSFILSPSLGESLFELNVNRILGVGMGLALGNLPAILLLKQDCDTDQCFLQYPIGPIVFVQLMFAQWAVSMYGFLATGSKYSRACLLWAGFSGVQMLRSLHSPHGQDGDNMDTKHAHLFMSTMDNMVGCLIVFGIDAVAAFFMSSRSTEQVALHISRCLLNVSDLLGRLRDVDSPFEASEQLSALKDSIKGSRCWDQQARSGDLIWSTPRLPTYKPYLVDAVLRHMDDVYTASWSLLAAARRSEEEDGMMSIIPKVLPECVPAWCRIYSRVLKESLSGEEDLNGNATRSVAPNPDPDSAQRIADDLLGDEEQGNATVLVMRANCCAMRSSLLQLQTFLGEHTFWEARAWQPEEEEDEESAQPVQLVRQWSHNPSAIMAMRSSDIEEGAEDEDVQSL